MAPATPVDPPLPDIVVPMDAEAVLAVLDTAARRGRLAGFEPGRNGVLFSAAAPATPFDAVIEARATPEGSSTRLSFSRRFKPLVPRIFIAVMLLGIWPGVLLMKSVLSLTFPSAHWLWETIYWWYLPLAIISTPFAISSAYRRSRKESSASAVETVQKITGELRRGQPAAT